MINEFKQFEKIRSITEIKATGNLIFNDQKLNMPFRTQTPLFRKIASRNLYQNQRQGYNTCLQFLY